MKKSLHIAVGAALSALLILSGLTGCSKSPKAETKASDLPASGATSYVTNQMGVTSVISSIADDMNFGYYIKYPEDIMDDLADVFKEAIDVDALTLKLAPAATSAYVADLTGRVMKIEKSATKAFENFEETGKIDYKFSEKPGKAKDFPAGVSLSIPEVSASIKGSMDVENQENADLTFNANAKASAAVDELAADIKTLKLNGKVKYDISGATYTVDTNVNGGLEFSFSAKGIEANYSCTDLTLAVNGKADPTAMTGNGKINGSVSGSGDLAIDFVELGYEESPIKYIKTESAAAISIEGNPTVKSAAAMDITGKVAAKYDVSSSTGIVFLTKEGVGGKAVLNSGFKVDAKVDLSKSTELYAQVMVIYSQLFESEQKLSEKEFNKLSIPLELNLSLKFYDDKNKETFSFVDLKSTYDTYSFVYDTLKTMGMDFSDLIDIAEEVVDTVEGMINGSSKSSYYDYSDYYDYYDYYDYSDYYGGWDW